MLILSNSQTSVKQNIYYIAFIFSPRLQIEKFIIIIFISIIDTSTLIKKGMTQNYTALIVKEYESVSLPSDSNIINSIRVESPDSEIQWSHNGIFLQNEQYRLEIKNYEISM